VEKAKGGTNEMSETKSNARNLTRNRWFIRIVTLILIIGGWQALGSVINPLFVSTPLAVAEAFVGLFAGTGNYSLVNQTSVTLYSMLVGFLLAVLVGIPIGLAMGIWRPLDIAFNPYVNALYVTPRIAMIPLIVIWFGIGFEAIVFTVFLTAVFPILINTYAGARNISKWLIDVADVFGVSGSQRFRKVIFPSTVPFLMTGLRLGLGQAFIGVIVAQLLLSIEGLGYMLSAFGDYYDTPQLIATILVLCIIGVALTSLVQFFERRIQYWRKTEAAFE
jgi:NitT/TauT family transport system permease protein